MNVGVLPGFRVHFLCRELCRELCRSLSTALHRQFSKGLSIEVAIGFAIEGTTRKSISSPIRQSSRQSSRQSLKTTTLPATSRSKAVFADGVVSEENDDAPLPFIWDASMCQLDAEHFFVDGLQESRAQGRVNGDGRADDLGSQFTVRHVHSHVHGALPLICRRSAFRRPRWSGL